MVQDLGLKLELGPDQLTGIDTKCKEEDAKLREMLQHRLSKGGLTWELIAKALEADIVGNKDLANRIRENHPPPRPPKKKRASDDSQVPDPKRQKAKPAPKPVAVPPGAPGPSRDPPPSKKNNEYYDESRFVQKSTLEKYRCSHCNKVPKRFFQCKCTARQGETEDSKKKSNDNIGVSCLACQKFPCSNCKKKSNYEQDDKREKNVRKLNIYCRGCGEKTTLEGEDKHLKEKCLKCKYCKIGCQEVVKGPEKEKHEKDLMKHFDLLVARVIELMDRKEHQGK